MTLSTAGVSMPKPRKSLALHKTEPEQSNRNRLPDFGFGSLLFFIA